MHQLQHNPQATHPPRTWKLTLAYDGSDFRGWQIQPSQPTIQGELAAAIHRITGEHILPQGSGRTDAGVHALGQVASFQLEAPIPEANLLRALNRTLPESIRVKSAEIVPPGFHARHSAIAKTYEYTIFRAGLCPPVLARYVYALNWPLNVEAMAAAAAHVLGEHDFTSFAAHDPDLATRNPDSPIQPSAEPPAKPPIEPPIEPNCIRTISESQWRQEGDFLIYRVTGNGFLHHMVRNLVGTFLNVGRGATLATAIPEILAAKSRSAAGPTAPARGLFLVAVQYPTQYSDPSQPRMLP